MSSVFFKHLSISNFMSYANAEIDLNRTGNVIVGGLNNSPEDNAKSNGCGKSSLFSALAWCLTGETVSGAKDVSNIYTSGKTEVSISFDFDNNEYKIIRTKNPSNLFIYINGENKSGKGIRDTEKLLSQYLPQLTSSLLNSVIILGQGLPQRFTNNTPAGRKEVLESLSNSDFMITDLKDRLSKRKLVLDSQKRDIQDRILTINTSISINTNTIDTLNNELSSFDSTENLELTIQSIQEKIIEINSEIGDQTEFVSELQEQYSDSLELQHKLNEEYTYALNSIHKIDTSDKQSELIELKSKASAINSKIVELNNITDICPTCGQKLPNVTKIDTSDLREEYDNLVSLIKELENTISDINEQNNKLVSDCSDKYTEKISSITSDINTLSIDLSTNQNKLNKLITEKGNYESTLATAKNSLLNLEDNINYRKNKILELKQINENFSNELYNINEQLSDVDNRLSINSKMQTLVKRDFRGYLLNNVITFIEKRAKLYATDVFGTDKLSFELSNNNINISYDGKDYSVLSGGEKQKLDVIIQFAIRDMLCTFLGFSSNILVLDEITDSLDSIGVGKIFNLIGSYLNDVEVVYIISHHTDELEIPADDEIIIIKGDDKLSRII